MTREEVSPVRTALQVQDLTGRAAVVGQLMSRAYQGDAGFDLVVQPNPDTREMLMTVQSAEPIREVGGFWMIKPGEFVDLPLGCAVQLPVGHWGMLTGRSSTLRKRRLMVAQGIIDNGYRGPLFAGVWNLGETVALVEPGARIAQLIPVPVFSGGALLVESLGESDRGEQGFGSSGR